MNEPTHEVIYSLQQIGLERDEHLNLRIAEAANYVRTALKGESRLKQTKQSKYHRLIYHRLHWVKAIVLGLYLLISFFEIPSWCSSIECSIDRSGEKIYPPMSSIPKLPPLILYSFEIIFLIFIGGMVLFRKTFIEESKTAVMRRYILLILVCSSLLDISIVLIRGSSVVIAGFIRPIVFVLFFRAVRECFNRICSVIRDALPVVLLIVLHILAFGWMGTILFSNTGEEQAYFSSLSIAFWNMLVLLTTANFPDIMMPAYSQNRLYALFFIIYLIVGLFFLLNLLLAVFYNNYRTQIDGVARKFVNERHSMLKNGFKLLDEHNSGYVNYSVVCDLLEAIRGDLHLREDREEELVTLFDLEKNGLISEAEFENLINSLKLSAAYHGRHEHFLQKKYPQWYSEGGWCAKYEKRLKSHYFEGFINFFNLTNLVFQLVSEVFGVIDYWIYFQILYLFVNYTEMTVKIIVLGPYRFGLSLANMFEMFLNILTLVIWFWVISSNDFESRNFLQFCMILRLFRVLRLLSEVEQYRIIFKTFKRLIPYFGTLLAVLMAIFYVFSIIGVFLFGGEVYRGNPLIDQNVDIPLSYVFNNFNDFGSGLMTLFELTVVNNWRVIVDMMVYATSEYYRWYFVLFYVLSVTVSLNLIVSFVIDMFYSQCEIAKDRERKYRRMKINEEQSHESDLVSPLVNTVSNPVVNLRSSLSSVEVFHRWVVSPKKTI